jgi:hypothetical protein
MTTPADPRPEELAPAPVAEGTPAAADGAAPSVEAAAPSVDAAPPEASAESAGPPPPSAPEASAPAAVPAGPLPIWRRPRVRFAAGAVVAVAALVGMYGPALRVHMQHSADPFIFNDDVRVQIYPFEHYRDRTLFPADYLGEYTLAAMAWGYRALYVLASWVWNAKSFSKVLPYLLLAIVVGALAKGASRWGKVAAPFFAVALALSSDAFFERMAGGLPRAFGFAIAASAAAALVHGRMRALAAITCLGAAFYPAAAMPCGMALALVALVYRQKDRGDLADTSFRGRLALVVGTGLVAAVLLVPTSLTLRKYGSYILEKDIATFPEAGPGGRFYAGDRPPYPGLVDDAKTEIRRTLAGSGERWSTIVPGLAKNRSLARWRDQAVYWLAAFAAIGFLPLAVRDEGARRLLAYAIAAAVGHVAAARVAPWLYLPQRYAVFPIPVLLCLMLPGAGSATPLLVGRRGDRPWLRAAFVLCTAAGALLLVGGRGSETVGLTVRLDPKGKLYPFLSTLPKDALIAGWPQTMDNVPYVSDRQALVTMECHVAFNQGYVLEMRRRMRALIDAYLATDRGPILKLRDELKVTHLLVDTRHFSSAPTYFKPFDGWVREAFAAGKKGGFELPRLAKQAAIFSDGPYVVIDLAQLAAAPPVEPAPAAP